jgi:AmiR/NasT family two-component response regulator
MSSGTPSPLRLLIADGRAERVRQVEEVIRGLGHHSVAHNVTLPDVGRVTSEEKPDLAIVVVEEGSDRAFRLIARIVREAACPVIAILDVQDQGVVNEAAKLGIFAYITGGDDPVELQSSIDIALRRFTEYHDLEGAFDRRATIERAKGILMERHSIEEREAFAMLRQHARRTNTKIMDGPGRGRRAPSPPRDEKLGPGNERSRIGPPTGGGRRGAG